MFAKILDTALDATFLAVNALSKLRKKLRSPTVSEKEEEDRLTALWVEARRNRLALQSELQKPTVSRDYDAQRKLLQAAKAAKDKCRNLVLALRAGRKDKGKEKDKDNASP